MYTPWLILGCLSITGIAAVTDARTGHIPNWLTLPALALGVLVHGVWGGLHGLLFAAIAIVACGLVPYLMFRRDACGGGDVKLFAALAALGGLHFGLEAQLIAYLMAGAFTLATLTWRGRLARTLGNALFLLVNPALPRRWRRPLTPELMTSVRLGPAIFAGTLAAALLRSPWIAA